MGAGTRTHESAADLLGRVPITLLMKSGTLRLADGRLSFTRSRNRVVFDVPMSEVHSIGISVFGITLWHGTTRYRFAIGHTSGGGIHPDNAVLALAAVAELPGAIRNYREARQDAYAWATILNRSAGPVPPGLVVKAPWPTWKVVLVVVGAFTAITAAIIVAALSAG